MLKGKYIQVDEKKTGKHLGNLQKLAQRPFQRAAIDILLEPFVDLLTQQTQSTSGKEALKKKQVETQLTREKPNPNRANLTETTKKSVKIR